MLNYMGPNIGSAPVTAGLPPAAPGTMPAAIPGAPPAISGLGPINAPRPMALSPAMAGAINPAGPGAPPPPQEDNDPASIQYDNITQEDGSVVMFIKKPDGSRGPAVKIITMKAPKAAA